MTKTPFAEVELFVSPPAGPSLHLPQNRVEEIRRLLDQHGLRYWVSERSLSINDGPYMTWIHFNRSTDPGVVRDILDSIPRTDE